MRPSRHHDRIFGALMGTAVALVLAMFLVLLGHVVLLGAPALSVERLLSGPNGDPTGGGLGPAIVGTVLLTLLMTATGVPFGVATAIYLAEYAPPDGRLARAVRTALDNLAAVPSVVYGLFGLGFFVLFVGGSIDALSGAPTPVWGRPSILWAALTLAVLTLPVVVVTAQEALLAVPAEQREAALALGATRVQTVLHVVFPAARAGILTGIILAVSRGAAEVAPILFTGVVDYLPHLPRSPNDMFMHLGHHVYVLATQSPDVDATRPVLMLTALVLLALTVGLNLVAIVLRSRVRKRMASA